jgi:4-amino-4-deoxy-L-arabinose transferase-like glycosyltransferase
MGRRCYKDYLLVITKSLFRRIPWILLLLLAAGGFFRFYGLKTGAPYSFHIDEWHILRQGLGMYRTHNLHPETLEYPTLLYYIPAAFAAIIGFFREPSMYYLQMTGRFTSAAFGTASIWAVYQLGKTCYGKQAGLPAAALFAVTVTAFREAHFATADTINTFFIILAILAFVRITTQKSLKQYLLAGVLIGLAAGTKYNGLLLLLPLLLAHFLRDAPAAGSMREWIRDAWQRRKALWHGYFLCSVFVALIVFAASTPAVISNYSQFFPFVNHKLQLMNSGIVPWNHHYFGTVPYLYYITNLLFWSMGPLMEIAGLSGMVYLIVRRRKQDWIIACWTLAYFALVGIWFNKASRYTLPMLPFLAIGAAVLFVEMKTYLSRCGRRFLVCAWTASGALVLVSGLLYSVAFLRIYARPHTGIQAAQWAMAHIPRESTILLEPTLWERPPIDGGAQIRPEALAGNEAERYRIKILDVLKFAEAKSSSAELAVLLHDALEGTEYIVISIRWCEALKDSPLASPVIHDYYRNLLGGTGDFIKVAEFTSYPGLGKYEWNDDWAELNFRIFDHPRAMIFKRKNPGQ